MGVPHDFWNGLINLNKKADALIERARKIVEPYAPITREIPFYAEVEVAFQNLPDFTATTVSPQAEIVAGNNVKRSQFTNHGSRVYIDQLSMCSYRGDTQTLEDGGGIDEYEVPQELRNPGDYFIEFPINWRWNFYTSITQKQYSNGKRCLAKSGGLHSAGTHLAFVDPLVIEPMETFVFECELLAFDRRNDVSATRAIIVMNLSGYREGV